MNYTFRAMELHDSTQICNLDEISKRLDFCVKNGLNAITFHEPGIESKIVFPAKFLGGSGTPQRLDAFWKLTTIFLNHALRENLNLNRRDYPESMSLPWQRSGSRHLSNKETVLIYTQAQKER